MIKQWGRARSVKTSKVVAIVLDENVFKSPCLCWTGGFTLNNGWTLQGRQNPLSSLRGAAFLKKICTDVYKNGGKRENKCLVVLLSSPDVPLPLLGIGLGEICPLLIVGMNSPGSRLSRFRHRHTHGTRVQTFLPVPPGLPGTLG